MVRSVLIIDDDEDDNFFHKMTIDQSGRVEKIIIAENALEALEIIRKNGHPDLIFLDTNMPKMNGWEFVSEYRKMMHPDGNRPIIVLLTTSMSHIDKALADRTPEINEFQIKPLSATALDRILQKYFSADIYNGDGSLP